MNICVFCSSSENLESDFIAAAKQLGEWIGKNAHTLVYGGSEKGLMKECAKAAKTNGGKIISIAPDFVINRGLLNPESDEVIKVAGLAERKKIMMEISDVFIALPGGIGTLDEIFSIAACNVVGECKKHITILNLNGIYDNLYHLLHTLKNSSLIRPDNLDNLYFCPSLEDFKKRINMPLTQ